MVTLMSELSDKIDQALEFLSPQELKSALSGTLEAIEEGDPGYTDTLILGILCIRAGMDPGEPYQPKEEQG